MNDVHLPVKNQKLIIKILGGRTLIAQFDEQTLEYLDKEIEKQETTLRYLGVSRFNARTGWGRCISAMDAVSVPFSPSALSAKQKSRLAQNLKGIAEGRFAALPLLVIRDNCSK